MRATAIVLCVVIAITAVCAAEPMPDPLLTLTLRIYDYQGLAPPALSTTQRLVSDLYRSIGIQTIWFPTRSPFCGPDPGTTAASIEDLSINVLSARRSALRPWQKDALGSAAVGQGGGGRIAYVRYDRVTHAARDADWSAADLLALVIAHEMGHLLLPNGSHSANGLMRGRWDVHDLRRVAWPALAFTPHQASQIRGALEARREFAFSRGN